MAETWLYQDGVGGKYEIVPAGGTPDDVVATTYDQSVARKIACLPELIELCELVEDNEKPPSIMQFKEWQKQAREILGLIKGDGE